MKYPSPKAALSQIASRGPSAVRLEALRLLSAPDCPNTWPECPRRSRLSLLRQLACDGKKSAKACLTAWKELIGEPKRNPNAATTPAREIPCQAVTVPETEVLNATPSPEMDAELRWLLYDPRPRGAGENPEPASAESLEPSSAPAPHPHSEPRPAPNSARAVQEAIRREAHVKRGKELAARTVEQYRRSCVAPWNREEQFRLNGLQREWAAWEKEAAELGVDVEAEFAGQLNMLRPYQRPVSVSDVARMRRSFTDAEWAGLSSRMAREAQRPARKETDGGGIWSGLPGGI